MAMSETNGANGVAAHARKSSASFTLGAVICAIFAVMAVVALFWTPYSVFEMNIASRLAPPTLDHPLGTDHFGRDVLSMIMIGTHNSIAVAVVAVAIGIVVGVPVGALAAARGGWIDEALMRTSDFVFAFPALLSAVMITALAGPGAINSIIAIGIFNMPVFARLTRGAALGVWQAEYIMAARLAGRGGISITLHHVLPNIAGVLIVQATIQFALAILAEAGLSYLGLGTQPPNPSWGRMLNDAQTMIHLAPHAVIVPGIAIALAVLGLNLMGDGLRDLNDPRLHGRS